MLESIQKKKMISHLEERLEKQQESIKRIKTENDLLRKKHEAMKGKITSQKEVIKKFQHKFTEILNINFSGPKKVEETIWDYDIEDCDENNTAKNENNNKVNCEEMQPTSNTEKLNEEFLKENDNEMNEC